MNNLFLIAYKESYKKFEIAMLGLQTSFEHCQKIGIKPNYTFEETEAFDALIIKLTRNSDIFFQQIIKGYFKLKGEDRLLFIDRLNLLEKMEVITNTDELLSLKSFRNQAVHEYSYVDFQSLYEEALVLTPVLKKSAHLFFEHLKKDNVL
ncbi:MAG: hypothetical protein EAZ53_08900 [Bacteroidetes bacterium]|nr:MAG: hypothetical protein EAZ53_08900 [Bacteroidota bacterium]